MNGVDIFSIVLGVAGLLLIGAGAVTLSRRDLELGALVGVVPLGIGMCVWALAALLFALQHVHISISI